MSWLGRAQLAQMLREAPAQAEEVAALLGYRRVETEPEPEKAPVGPARRPGRAPVAGAVEPPAMGRHGRLDMPLWRVARLQHSSEPPPADDATPPPLPATDPGDVLFRLPTAPAAPWSDLWPRVFELVAERHPGHTLDVPAVVHHLSRSRPLDRLPRRTHLRWPDRLTVWVDRSEALTPLWDDQDHLVRRLEPWCERVDVHVGRHEFAAGAGDTVLLLGDLPGLDTPAWRRRARRWRGQGVRLGAVSATPASLPEWRSTPWSTHVARDGTPAARARRLLVLAAQAAWVRPGMLRALRLCLPPAAADLRTELDAWAHEAVVCAHVSGLVIDPRHLRELGRELAALPEALQKRVREVIEAWHGGMPEELRHVEDVLWRGAGEAGAAPFDMGRSEAFFTAAATLVRGGRAPHLQAFVRRASDVLASALDHAPHLREAVSTLWGAGHPEAGAEVPHEVDPRFARAARPPAPVSAVAVVQRGDAFTMGAVGQGFHFATLQTTQPTWWVTRGDVRRQLVVDQAISTQEVTRIRIETDRSTLDLDRVEPPWWAAEMARDGDGLWAEAELDGERLRLRWVLDRDGAGRWESVTRVATGGRVGADAAGLYEDVELFGVEVRFRRIPAGTFMMGSPEHEAGRWDDEGPQHEVTLTESFWLAETPTTQALWTAVMGENPSRFVHPSRPIERVSWDDAQRFIQKLNAEHPFLNARLPTEAQWEYACRAGTTTATYAGDLEILGERDAPVLDAIAWYGGNSGVDFDLERGHDTASWREKQYPHTRAGTRLVKTKAANPWGLFDMLGNVLEWCDDRWSNKYPAEPQVNPEGPQGGAFRVFRGGSWHSFARLVRAAFRYGHSPGYRNDDLGFRLSRGPAPSARSAGGRRPEGERSEPGRGAARRGGARRRGAAPGEGGE